MAQYEMNLRDYWQIVRRRRWIVLVSVVVAAAVAFWVGQKKVPSYQATAAVKFEQSTALTGLLVEVLSYSSADNIETQASLIKSYPILEEVARRMGRLPQAGGTEALRESRAYTATLEASPASCAPTAWAAPASSRSPRSPPIRWRRATSPTPWPRSIATTTGPTATRASSRRASSSRAS